MSNSPLNAASPIVSSCAASSPCARAWPARCSNCFPTSPARLNGPRAGLAMAHALHRAASAPGSANDTAFALGKPASASVDPAPSATACSKTKADSPSCASAAARWAAAPALSPSRARQTLRRAAIAGATVGSCNSGSAAIRSIPCAARCGLPWRKWRRTDATSRRLRTLRTSGFNPSSCSASSRNLSDLWNAPRVSADSASQGRGATCLCPRPSPQLGDLIGVSAYSASPTPATPQKTPGGGRRGRPGRTSCPR